MPLIVLEGMRGTGKTTLGQALQKHFTRKIPAVYTHHDRGCSTDSLINSEIEMVNANPNTLFIFDRWYLSELAYSKLEGRNSTLTRDRRLWAEYENALDRPAIWMCYFHMNPYVNMTERMAYELAIARDTEWDAYYIDTSNEVAKGAEPPESPHPDYAPAWTLAYPEMPKYDNEPNMAHVELTMFKDAVHRINSSIKSLRYENSVRN